MALKSFWKLNISVWVSRLLLLGVLLSSSAMAVVDTYPFSREEDSRRFQALTTELRCLVCHGQSLAQSDAPLAQDFRRKIYQLIKQHKSDAEIKAFLVKRYGQFILFSPPVTAVTWLLWCFPALLLGVALALIFFHNQINTQFLCSDAKRKHK